MPRGKKELAEQISPRLREVEARWGEVRSCRGGEEDRCDGADVLQMEEAVGWPSN